MQRLDIGLKLSTLILRGCELSLKLANASGRLLLVGGQLSLELCDTSSRFLIGGGKPSLKTLDSGGGLVPGGLKLGNLLRLRGGSGLEFNDTSGRLIVGCGQRRLKALGLFNGLVPGGLELGNLFRLRCRSGLQLRDLFCLSAGCGLQLGLVGLELLDATIGLLLGGRRGFQRGGQFGLLTLQLFDTSIGLFLFGSGCGHCLFVLSTELFLLGNDGGNLLARVLADLLDALIEGLNIGLQRSLAGLVGDNGLLIPFGLLLEGDNLLAKSGNGRRELLHLTLVLLGLGRQSGNFLIEIGLLGLQLGQQGLILLVHGGHLRLDGGLGLGDGFHLGSKRGDGLVQLALVLHHLLDPAEGVADGSLLLQNGEFVIGLQ